MLDHDFSPGDFADDAGVPNPDLPLTSTRVTMAEQGEGATQMEIEALGQTDAILRESVSA